MTVALLVLIAIELTWLVRRDFLNSKKKFRYYLTTTLRRRQ